MVVSQTFDFSRAQWIWMTCLSVCLISSLKLNKKSNILHKCLKSCLYLFLHQISSCQSEPWQKEDQCADPSSILKTSVKSFEMNPAWFACGVLFIPSVCALFGVWPKMLRFSQELSMLNMKSLGLRFGRVANLWHWNRSQCKFVKDKQLKIWILPLYLCFKHTDWVLVSCKLLESGYFWQLEKCKHISLQLTSCLMFLCLQSWLLSRKVNSLYISRCTIHFKTHLFWSKHIYMQVC